ncbi:MAG: hypothetical protein JWQ03_2742 [Variovorax sp.]|nr:hypothetical protein [Variovorax sp.]
MAGLAAALAALAAAAWALGAQGGEQTTRITVPPADVASAVPLAVLGDSNSHSYQDNVSFRPGARERGGALRPRTLQWTEVLARLRGREIDLGEWGTWGHAGAVAQGRELLGLRGDRAPRKADYLYNFANSGAGCRDLTEGRFRQAPRLLALMGDEPERWRRGVVVIRIGLNDWGGLLDLQSREPAAPPVRAATATCADRIRQTLALIHAAHPETRVVIVGIGNEADDPAQFDKWRSGAEMANIKTALASFNGALRQLAAGNARVSFFDDLAWFEKLWGTRDAQGRPAYKTVALGSLRVTNTAGDDPRNALVADHHAGLVWNALWAQALVIHLRDAFGLPLTPIGDKELAGFVEALVGRGVAPSAVRTPGA